MILQSFLISVLPGPALPSVTGVPFDGAGLSLLWGLPFALILLSLAVGPMLFSKIWHHHYGKIIMGFTLAFLIPACHTFGTQAIMHHVNYNILSEYVPFVILIGSLFVVTGGIRLKAQWLGTPGSNLLTLGLGTLAASFIGTTGASMLLIRPLLRANAWRKRTAHVSIFFIFLVANIGGSLTPLGDPPLFLGFLEGVPFFWPMQYMALPLAFTAGAALTVFYCIDQYLYRYEEPALRLVHDNEPMHRLSFEGGINIFFLLSIIAAVLLSGLWKPVVIFTILDVPLKLENITRDVLLLLITGASFLMTKPLVRHYNQFSFEPLIEVAKIFFGIFITVVPVIIILKAGTEGALGPFVGLVSKNGLPYNPAYFWMTGFFSSFLDNAPTYFVFFNMAGGQVKELTATLSETLLAISTGAVFMGAMTYIGNAPNFMVKSIAEKNGVKMPGFFGYMGWSLAILLPIFLLMTWIFFV
jgi:Na+/H+ antiporter NhaD/arsenite permease-like protein